MDIEPTGEVVKVKPPTPPEPKPLTKSTNKVINGLTNSLRIFYNEGAPDHEHPASEQLVKMQINEFWQIADQIDSELKDKASFTDTMMDLTSLMREIEIFTLNQTDFPFKDVLIERILSIARKNFAAMEENIDIKEKGGDYLNRFLILDMLSYLKHYNYEDRQICLDFLVKHKEHLIDSNNLQYRHFHSIFTRLFSNSVYTKQEEDLISEFLDNQFTDSANGPRLAQLVLFAMEHYANFLGQFLSVKTLEHYGITPEKAQTVVEKWTKTATVFERQRPKWEYPVSVPEAFERNLSTLSEIEKEKLGIARFLLENFGIHCFGRYPKKLLLKQMETDDNQKPFGIILYPLNDRNGAFYLDKDILSGLLDDLGDDYILRVVEAENKLDIAKALIRLKKKYQPKISFAIIGGHGQKDSIQFGSVYKESNLLTIKDLIGHGVRRTNEFFEENPTIILESCSTGKEEGIGQQLSEMLGAKIIAPNIQTGLESIHAVKRNGRLDFNVEFRDKGSVKTFSRGENTAGITYLQNPPGGTRAGNR